MASKKNELHDKHQAILARLLRDEDNKYCVDCDTKGPRWASWNLGIFLCIRCAGIHRNLGVHISKVKSINLDSWQPEQIAMMEDMGNSRARAVYEANLPDHYKRPSTSDQAMEQFIRAKYEHKKYIAREWIPPKPRSHPSHYQDEEKKKERKSKTVLTIPGAAAGTAKSKEVKSTPANNQNNTPAVTPAATNGVTTQAKAPTATQPDLLGDFMSSSNLTAVTQPSSAAKLASEDLFSAFGPTNPPPTQPITASQTGPTQAPSGDNSDLFSLEPPEEKSKSAKDSIMALYGNTAQMQQPAVQPVFQQSVQPGMQPGMQQGYQQAYNMQGAYGQPHMAHNMMYANMQQQNPGMMGMYNQPRMAGMPAQPVGMQPQPVGMQHQMGYYAQPQQNMMYTNQVQSQMANMSINQAQMGIQQNAVTANKPQTNGQTLNFDLWN